MIDENKHRGHFHRNTIHRLMHNQRRIKPSHEPHADIITVDPTKTRILLPQIA